MGKFKVGDVVRCVPDCVPDLGGHVFTIERIDGDGDLWGRRPGGAPLCVGVDEVKLEGARDAADEPAPETKGMTVSTTNEGGALVYTVTDEGGHKIINARADDLGRAIAAIDAFREAVAKGWPE